jgi:Ca2+-transporting ATPase
VTDRRLPPVLEFEELQKISGESGLSGEQVPLMRDKYGGNILTPPKLEPVWKQYLRKYDDPIIKILFLAVFISGAVAVAEGTGLFDTIAILLAILLATGISFVSEYRSNRAFDALNAERGETPVKAIRDNKPTLVPLKDIVVGDLTIVEAGDGVPADGWLVSADDLSIDESLLSGESDPVDKQPHDPAYRGTFVAAGRGMLLSAAVGDGTKMGTIAASLGSESGIPTPLEQKLSGLARLISTFAYMMALLVTSALLVKGILAGDISGINLATLRNILDSFMLAVVIIVVAIPEGLPMSVTLSLSLAMRKMVGVRCLVRRLIACETIGSATVICTDKTGTLTKNQMTVVESSIARPVFPAGIPDSPAGWIAVNAAVNSTAYIEHRGDIPVTVGNLTEGALLQWLNANAIQYQEVRKKNPALGHHFFDPVRKRMSTVVGIGGHRWLLVKGAPEIVATFCASPVDLTHIDRLASRAIRTLGFAHKEITDGDDSEAGLTWDGYVGIRDDIREDVPEAVLRCQEAGISVRMITGDKPETAKAIAAETGIRRNGILMSGSEFRALPEELITEVARNLEVLSRAEPVDKLNFVRALQEECHVVAVTGDGTNDAPALKTADVGLAMGKTGTEVAREASDIIILDDSFATITSAVWWGRSLYENIQRFVQFQITINISACILVFIAPFLGYRPPFTIIQLLWINIIMDTLAALALCMEAPYEGLMKNRPVPRGAQIVTPMMWLSIVITSLFYCFIGFIHMMTGFLGGTTTAEQHTVFFAFFVLASVWNGINCRAVNGTMPPFFRGNPVFFMVMGVIVLLQYLIVQYGGRAFDTVPLSSGQWVFLVFVSASVLILGLIIRIIGTSSLQEHPESPSPDE